MNLSQCFWLMPVMRKMPIMRADLLTFNWPFFQLSVFSPSINVLIAFFCGAVFSFLWLCGKTEMKVPASVAVVKPSVNRFTCSCQTITVIDPYGAGGGWWFQQDSGRNLLLNMEAGCHICNVVFVWNVLLDWEHRPCERRILSTGPEKYWITIK